MAKNPFKKKSDSTGAEDSVTESEVVEEKVEAAAEPEAPETTEEEKVETLEETVTPIEEEAVEPIGESRHAKTFAEALACYKKAKENRTGTLPTAVQDAALEVRKASETAGDEVLPTKVRDAISLLLSL